MIQYQKVDICWMIINIIIFFLHILDKCITFAPEIRIEV